ncbi:MAG TPA: hypothetical protein VFQ00_01900 [Terriglobales bacterium]|nr:hypothetical protein [Terriglobales bacterium]
MVSKRQSQLPSKYQVQSVAVILITSLTLIGCGANFNGGSSPDIDFSLSVSPGAQTIVAGHGAGFAVTVNPPAMLGAVSLNTSALPAGVTAAFSRDLDPITGQRTLNIFTSQSTPAGSSTITVFASDTNKTRRASVSLTITPAADFSMAVNPSLQTIKPSMSATYAVSVAFRSGAAGPVTFSTSGLPSTATAKFDPPTLTSSGTTNLTLTAGPEIVAKLVPVNVIASDNSGTITVPITLVISPADFSLSLLQGPFAIQAGGTFAAQVGVQGLFDATPGTVTLSATGLPAGVGVSFQLSTITGSGNVTMLISASPSTVTANYTFAIKGQDASGKNIESLPLTVLSGMPGADLFLGVSTLTETISAGETATFEIFVSNANGPQAATMSASPDKSDVQASVVPVENQTGVYQLIVTTGNPQTTPGVATITVSATDTNSTQSIPVQVTIEAGPPSS